MKKRLLAIVLVMAMMLTFMPTTVFAMDLASNTKGMSKSSQDGIRFPFGEDQEILLRSSFSIYPTADLYHEGASEGEEWTEEVPLVNATIVSQHPETQGQVVIELIKGSEEGQYEIESKNYGYAFVETVYRAEDGQEYKNQFKVSVVRELYDFYLDIPSGKSTILPRGSIAMKASAEKSFYTADGKGELIYVDATDKFTYEWNSDASEGEIAIVPDSSDTSCATISAGNNAEGDYEISVTAKDSKGKTVSTETRIISIRTEFYDIEFSDLNQNMEQGEECVVKPLLYKYSTELSSLNNYRELVGDVYWEYEFTDDEPGEYVTLSKEADGWRIKKLTSNGFSLHVIAMLSGEELADGYLSVSSTHHSLGFEEPGDFVVTKDETARTFHLNREGIATDLANGYTVRFKVGEWRWGEDADFTGKYYDGCFTVDGINVTLDGRKLHAAGAETICIRAEMLKGDNVVGYTDLYGDVYEEYNPYDPDDPEYPDGPEYTPTNLTFSFGTNPLKGIIGTEFIHGNYYYREGNSFNVEFEDGHTEEYIFVEKYLEEEDTYYVGFFKDGVYDEDGVNELVCNLLLTEGESLSEGDNNAKLVAYVNGVELESNAFNVVGVSETDIDEELWGWIEKLVSDAQNEYSAASDKNGSASTAAQDAAEAVNQGATNAEGKISSAEKLAADAEKAASVAAEAAAEALKEAQKTDFCNDDKKEKAISNAQAVVEAATKTYATAKTTTASVKTSSANFAGTKAAAAARVAASAPVASAEAVRATEAAQVAANDAKAKAQVAVKAANEAKALAEQTDDEDLMGAANTALKAAQRALTAASAAADSANKAAADAKTAKANADAADAQAKEKAAADAKAKEKEAVSNINKGTVTAADIKKASDLGATTVTLGASVKKISKNAFKGTGITTIVVKTKKLKAKSVKGSLKGSKVKTVKVQIGSKKVNKKYVKKYKKFFTKKNAGKKAKVK